MVGGFPDRDPQIDTIIIQRDGFRENVNERINAGNEEFQLRSFIYYNGCHYTFYYQTNGQWRCADDGQVYAIRAIDAQNLLRSGGRYLNYDRI